MPDPFITTVDLGNYLNRDLSSYAGAQAAVEGACDVVRTITEQVFDETTAEVLVLDGSGTDCLLLPQQPVTAVVTVTEDGTILTEGTDFGLDPERGALLKLSTATCWPSVWRAGRLNVSVTYSHGYALDAFPNDIRQVAINLAARLLQQTSGVVFEQLGQYQVRYGTASPDLTSTEKIILRKYKVTK